MSVRERPGDVGAADARRFAADAASEIRTHRRLHGLSQRETARRSGMSASQFGRLERGLVRRPTQEQLCRAGRAVGLVPAFRFYPGNEPAHDRAQLALLARFERVLGAPLRLRREVPLPIAGDRRAWDGRVTRDGHAASVEGEARLDDVQALTRRLELKLRDDPAAGVVILVVNQTAHNREVLRAHREALRPLLPLDGAAVLRFLRRGQVPPLGGIVLI